MNQKKQGAIVLALLVALLIADQVLKIWVKTHMAIDDHIMVIGNWFQLRFVENNGAAFGMQIASSGAIDWGKLLLSIFRVVMIGLLGWYITHLWRQKSPTGVLVGLTMILAGAIGNVVDSAIYGLIFSESTPYTIAQFGGSYAPFMMGKVVDMFYFPLFQWNSCPSWLDFLVDRDNYFFGAIFNLADAYISVALVYLIIFHYKYFNK